MDDDSEDDGFALTSLATSSAGKVVREELIHDESAALDWERMVTDAVHVINRTPLRNLSSSFSRLDIPFTWNAPLNNYLNPPTRVMQSVIAPLPPVPSIQSVLRADTGVLMSAAVRRAKIVPWPEQQEARRDRALKRWRMIVEENLSATNLGLSLHEAAVELSSDERMKELVEDTFAKKATSTLDKRAGCLLLFLVWHRKQYGIAGLPLKEKAVYTYVKEVLSKKAPTSSASLLSSIRFSKFLLHMKGADEVLDSAKISGACHNAKLKKRPLKQRRTLKVPEVQSMEISGVKAGCNFDRMASLFFVAQLYLRARYNDLCAADPRELLVDTDFEGLSGFFEAPTMHSKVQNTADKKTRFLPMAAPWPGVSNFNWAQAFIEERARQGISHFRWLLPTPSVTGKWVDSPTPVSVATKWLRSLLANCGHKEGLDLIGTHSLKATGLSWIAKHGSVGLTERALLGYHIPAENMSAVTYSRDALAHPLNLFRNVLDDIRNQRFDPDSSRSGRFKTIRQPTVIPTADVATEDPYGTGPPDELWAEETAPEVEGDDSYSESSSSSSDSEVDSAAALTLARHRVKSVGNVEGKIPYVHKVSKFLHYRLEAASALKCGRPLTVSLTKTAWEHTSGYSNCMQCFGSR